MNATVNGQEVEVTAGVLLHGAMADTFDTNVTATEGELGWDTESERIEAIAEIAAKRKQKEIARRNREARRKKGSGAYKGNWKPSKGTRVVTTTTGKMTKAEFDGSKAKHDKIMERDASGKRVHNCAAAKAYRHQVYEYMSKQRDDAGNLIRTEHPDARAVQLAGI
tara:strand:+ start:615 stop:1112 length:498 start_codon:yes stop_codon:yes gene_type:complete